MRESDFIFDSVQLLYYKYHKIIWLNKNQKATINPKTKDDKCFQYTVTIAFNYGEIESYPEFRILNRL